MFGLWWPVVLIAVAAPFVVHGYDWLQAQRTIAVHERQLTAERTEAEKARVAAYALGYRTATAEIRAAEQGEAERTREVIKEVFVEVPPPTPAEIVELCKRSASCRERRTLK
jgi:hypothetical protein